MAGAFEKRLKSWFDSSLDRDYVERRLARRAFGLPDAGRLALVVAGSWGAREVRETTADLAGLRCRDTGRGLWP